MVVVGWRFAHIEHASHEPFAVEKTHWIGLITLQVSRADGMAFIERRGRRHVRLCMECVRPLRSSRDTESAEKEFH